MTNLFRGKNIENNNKASKFMLVLNLVGHCGIVSLCLCPFQEPQVEPLANTQYHEFDDIDLHEVVLVDPNQFVTVNAAQVKEYEKIAEKNEILEQKVKEYERIVNEMKLKEKKNQSVNDNLNNVLIQITK